LRRPTCKKPCSKALEAHYQAALQAIPNGRAKDVGRMIGAACAAANLAKRADDGHDRAGPPFSAEPVYVPGNDVGDYQFTPSFDTIGFAAGPAWGDVTPFGIKLAKHRTRPPLQLRSLPYAADFNYTKAIGRVDSTLRTAEQSEIAQFWYELSPSGWNRIANVVIDLKDVEPWDAARILTLVNFALADGYIAGFDAKYQYAFWRPITAIRAAGSDGNPFTHPDPDWSSLCESPPVPDHPSTHTILGAAAAEVAISYFGDRTAFATTSASLPGVTRRYKSFTHAAVENGLSRIYCGIHFVNAVTEGYRAGESIGREIAKLLPPVKPGKRN